MRVSQQLNTQSDLQKSNLHQSSQRWIGWSSILLVTIWLGANARSVLWIWRSFAAMSRFNLALMGAGIILLLVQAVRHKIMTDAKSDQAEHDQTEQPSLLVWRSVPLSLMLGSGTIAAVSHWLVGIEQITILLFILGSYGLLGLFIAPSAWRKGLPAAILLTCLLPFNVQVGSGLGFPARVLTAQAVEQFLSMWHIVAISSNDIIVMENGIAHVDLPCSGLKSLWVGTLLLLAATWLERRKIGARWLLVGAANIVFLIYANIIRVLVLVLVTYVLRQPDLAEMLHLPLGVMGFLGACGSTWLLLQKVPKSQEPKFWVSREQLPQLSPSIHQSITPSPLLPQQFIALLFAIVLLGALPQLHQVQKAAAAIVPLHLPVQIAPDRLPLTTAEQRFFSSYPDAVPQKLRFTSGTISGSMLLVSGNSWQAFHSPELCYAGNGLRVDQMESQQLTDMPVRWLSLEKGQLSAVYWFQSRQQVTDDFLSRLWSEVSHPNQTWVMVSVLFDRPQRYDSQQIQTFAKTVRESIALQLNVNSNATKG